MTPLKEKSYFELWTSVSMRNLGRGEPSELWGNMPRRKEEKEEGKKKHLVANRERTYVVVEKVSRYLVRVYHYPQGAANRSTREGGGCKWIKSQKSRLMEV